MSFNVPFGYYYNRHPNPYTGSPATRRSRAQIFLTSYSLRLGKRIGPPASDQPRHRWDARPSTPGNSSRHRLRPAAPPETYHAGAVPKNYARLQAACWSDVTSIRSSRTAL